MGWDRGGSVCRGARVGGGSEGLKWPFAGSDGFELRGESIETVGDKGCNGEHLFKFHQF
jgi:hypothetical protein